VSEKFAAKRLLKNFWIEGEILLD